MKFTNPFAAKPAPEISSDEVAQYTQTWEDALNSASIEVLQTEDSIDLSNPETLAKLTFDQLTAIYYAADNGFSVVLKGTLDSQFDSYAYGLLTDLVGRMDLEKANYTVAKLVSAINFADYSYNNVQAQRLRAAATALLQQRIEKELVASVIVDSTTNQAIQIGTNQSLVNLSLVGSTKQYSSLSEVARKRAMEISKMGITRIILGDFNVKIEARTPINDYRLHVTKLAGAKVITQWDAGILIQSYIAALSKK